MSCAAPQIQPTHPLHLFQGRKMTSNNSKRRVWEQELARPSPQPLRERKVCRLSFRTQGRGRKGPSLCQWPCSWDRNFLQIQNVEANACQVQRTHRKRVMVARSDFKFSGICSKEALSGSLFGEHPGGKIFGFHGPVKFQKLKFEEPIEGCQLFILPNKGIVKAQRPSILTIGSCKESESCNFRIFSLTSYSHRNTF